MIIKGKFYDGKSSQEYIVEVEFTQDKRVKIDTFNIDEPIERVKISNRLGNTPRVLEFSNGARCKCDDNDAIDSALKKLNIKISSIHKLEKSWRLALFSVLFIATFIIFMLTFGSNYTAEFISNRLPDNILDSASKKTLRELDNRYLHKSNLSNERKAQVLKLFKRLTNNDPHFKLHFRSSPLFGPNAFALPSGDIVLIDELVFLDKDKNLYGVLGILAHEKGHYVYKHALKSLIKGAIATSIVSYFTGDVSFIVTSLPTALITSKYSRNYELQADEYAKSQLHKLGISTKPLSKIFIEIERYNRRKNGKSNKPSLFNYLSSHPITSKRVEYFNKD